MLRKRSRAMSNKQGLMMTDPSTLSSPKASPLFPSPRFFVGFSAKWPSDSEASSMSPTSILETKPLANFFTDGSHRNPIRETITNITEAKHHPWSNGYSSPIGLGILDDKSPKLDSKIVHYGSQLKIQIPSPRSPVEMGGKNQNSQLAMLSLARKSPMGPANTSPDAPPTPSSPGVFDGCLSTIEMEHSEEYTRVIAHGPNPKTTHIFNNCIVSHPSDDFLKYCYSCKKKLAQGKDIYMYRGEKAFCSSECRCQEMLFDEGVEMVLSDPSGTL